jgi:hypothetical protein
MDSVANNETLLSRSGIARSAFVLPGLVAAVGDPEGTRTVTSIIALLVALGVGLVMLAVWLFRTTRPDPELLAPLEVMGERRWRRGDPVWQRRRLDEIRPPGALPIDRASAPPDFDESFDDGPSAPGFDDLHGAGLDHADGPQEFVGRQRTPAVGPVATGDDADRASGGDTPSETVRPPVDQLPDGDIDPAVLASAMAALDAELRRRQS